MSLTYFDPFNSGLGDPFLTSTMFVPSWNQSLDQESDFFTPAVDVRETVRNEYLNITD